VGLGHVTGAHRSVSLLATVVALVLGVGVGAGPLADRSASEDAAQQAQLTAQVDRLQVRAASLRAQTETDAQALSALASPLVGDRLEGRTVVVVATPGAEKTDVRLARRSLRTAGAAVVTTLTLTGTYVDPAQAQSPLEDLALRLVPPGVEFPDGATPIERVGTVLARAVVRRPDEKAGPRSRIDQDAAEVIAGLDELGALRLAGKPGTRAELAVVVTGSERQHASAALLGLASALDAGSHGSVLVGPGDAQDGPLRWVREASASGVARAFPVSGASTVDGVRGPAGRVALVLALAQQLDGGSGAYGAGRRADAVIPPATG